MNLFLFWRLKVNLSTPHGEELEGLWSKWPFPPRIHHSIYKEANWKESIYREDMKRLIFMKWARFSRLSVVIVRCAHSEMRLFQSNSLKMDSQSQHCSNVSLEQLFPKTQFRSRRRCQTRQWPRRWWNWTKRRRRSSLTSSTRQTQRICNIYFEVFKMHWWKRRFGYDIQYISE